MLTDAERELLKTQPERFSSLIFHIPQFASLDVSSITIEIEHEGRYIGESKLSGYPIIDPYTPKGPLVSLGQVKDIQESLVDPTEFNRALRVFFTVINDAATKQVRS